jgi:Ca2+-binding EF-hand superfamily protein
MISPRLLLAFVNLGIVGFANADVASHTVPAGQEQAATVSGPRRVSPLIAALDRDLNGVLSEAEIAHASVVLRALDVNDDGILTVAELRGELSARRMKSAETPERMTRTARSGTGFTLAFALDANHDGDIQTMEVANAASSLRTLDRNHDGQLTSDELRFDLARNGTALAMAN